MSTPNTTKSIDSSNTGTVWNSWSKKPKSQKKTKGTKSDQKRERSLSSLFPCLAFTQRNLDRASRVQWHQVGWCQACSHLLISKPSSLNPMSPKVLRIQELWWQQRLASSAKLTSKDKTKRKKKTGPYWGISTWWRDSTSMNLLQIGDHYQQRETTCKS